MDRQGYLQVRQWDQSELRMGDPAQEAVGVLSCSVNRSGKLCRVVVGLDSAEQCGAYGEWTVWLGGKNPLRRFQAGVGSRS